MLRTGFCPNYFIPSVNLWGREILGNKAEKVQHQGVLGCEIINKTMNGDISKTIIPNIFRSEILLQHIYSLPPSQFYPLATLLLVMTECVVLPGLPVLGLALIVAVQTTVSWLLGTVTCLPLLLIYSVTLLTTKYLLTHRNAQPNDIKNYYAGTSTEVGATTPPPAGAIQLQPPGPAVPDKEQPVNQEDDILESTKL